MAASTPRGVNYPTADDKIKDGSSASALADDFAVLATSADAAITAGVQEAKDDSTTKYGGLPARVAAAESDIDHLQLTKWFHGELGIGSLDTLFTIGLHYTRSSQVATSITGKPTDSRFNNPFKVLVEPISINNGIYKQTIETKITGSTKTFTMCRTSLNNSWLGWVLDGEDQAWDKGRMSTGDDLNSFLSSGTRYADTSTVSGSILNKPPTFDGNPFSVTITALSVSNGIYLQEASQKIAGAGVVRSAYRISLGSVYEDWQDSASGKETLRDTGLITILGDSQSQKTETSWDTYAGALLDGTTLITHARSGDESNTILFREGVKEIVCTVDGGVIPSSGSVNLSTKMYIQERTDRIIISGTLGGVSGYVTYISPGVLTFTRSGTGAAVSVSGFMPFKSTWGQGGSAPTNAHAIIAWFGGNDFNYAAVGSERDTADHIIGNYRQFVEYCHANGYRPIIAGVTNRATAVSGSNGFAQVQRVNNTLREIFPDIFLDVQAYYVEHAIYDAGLTPTAADLLAIGRGEIPPQLLTDGIHLVPAAHQAIGEKWIAPWLVAQGYATSTQELATLPALAPADSRPQFSIDTAAGRTISAWDPAQGKYQLVTGDTGWRNVSSLLINGWTGTARIRRTGDLVFFRVYALNGDSATSPTFMNGIVGFRDVLSKFTLPSGISIDISASYSLAAPIGSKSSTSRYEQASWPTFDTAWPAISPGIPA